PGTKATVEHIRKIALERPEPVRGILPPEDKKKEAAGKKPGEPKDEKDSDQDDPFKSTKFVFKELPLETARAELKAGTIRAILYLPITFESDIEQQLEPAVLIEYDQAERVSQSAAARVRAMLERYE